jgi:hypothetical protein
MQLLEKPLFPIRKMRKDITIRKIYTPCENKSPNCGKISTGQRLPPL